MSANEMGQRVQSLVRQDNPLALEILYDEFAPALLAFLLSRLRHRADAEDTLQHLFLDLTRRPRQLLNVRDLRPWLFAKARNLSIDRLRARARQTELAAEMERETASDWMGTARSSTPAGADDAILAAAVDRLPADQRDVVALKAFAGLTFAAIAERLDISIHTAASRWRYAIERLRAELGEDPRHEPG